MSPSPSLLWCLAAVACTTTPPATGAPPPSGAPCAIEVSIEREASGGFWFLHAVATNRTDATLSIELHGRCPGGAANFSGLGDDYDYYGTCVMGACPQTENPIIELPPGKPVRVSTAVVSPGGSGCQPNLPASVYTVEVELPLVKARSDVCRKPLRIEHQLE